MPGEPRSHLGGTTGAGLCVWVGCDGEAEKSTNRFSCWNTSSPGRRLVVPPSPAPGPELEPDRPPVPEPLPELVLSPEPEAVLELDPLPAPVLVPTPVLVPAPGPELEPVLVLVDDDSLVLDPVVDVGPVPAEDVAGALPAPVLLLVLPAPVPLAFPVTEVEPSEADEVDGFTVAEPLAALGPSVGCDGVVPSLSARD